MSGKMDDIKAEIARPMRREMPAWEDRPLTRDEATWLVSEVDRLTQALGCRTIERDSALIDTATARHNADRLTRELAAEKAAHANERSAREHGWETLGKRVAELAERTRERDAVITALVMAEEDDQPDNGCVLGTLMAGLRAALDLPARIGRG